MSKAFRAYYISPALNQGKDGYFTIQQSTVDKAVEQFHGLMQVMNGVDPAQYKFTRITQFVAGANGKEEVEVKFHTMTNPKIGENTIQFAPVREVRMR